MLFLWTFLASFTVQTWAFDGVVEKKEFHLPVYQTVGGRSIPDLRIGYETYGQLNATRDNVILVTHYFSGTSHAAGKYASTDAQPGYWDAIIGAGLPLDTNKYFVISSDTLVNLNVGNPHVITTGPASVNPATGKPYAMDFPIVTIRDFVNVQKQLLDSLGIKKLHAVIGPSMGAMQAIQWAASYPDFVERSIPVIPAGLEANPYVIATLDVWAQPIRLDPNWKQGNYYASTPPTEGLVASLKAVAVSARSLGWADAFGRAFTNSGLDPLQSFDNSFSVESFLDKATRMSAQTSDANSFLYIVRAVQTFSMASDVGAIKAKVLWLPAQSDVLLFPEYSLRANQALNAQGVSSQVVEIPGTGGHMDGLLNISSVGSTIASFLTN